jgi:uncharacterized membrane protein HdeD (DUF308 family)
MNIETLAFKFIVAVLNLVIGILALSSGLFYIWNKAIAAGIYFLCTGTANIVMYAFLSFEDKNE